MKNCYKNQLRAIFCSLLLVTSVSAVETVLNDTADSLQKTVKTLVVGTNTLESVKGLDPKSTVTLDILPATQDNGEHIHGDITDPGIAEVRRGQFGTIIWQRLLIEPKVQLKNKDGQINWDYFRSSSTLFLKALRNTEIMLEPGGKFFIEPTYMSLLFEGVDFKYSTQGFCKIVDPREIGCVITALEKALGITNKTQESEGNYTDEESKGGNEDRNSRTSLFDITQESEGNYTDEESKDGNEDRNSRTSLFDIILSKLSLLCLERSPEAIAALVEDMKAFHKYLPLSWTDMVQDKHFGTTKEFLNNYSTSIIAMYITQKMYSLNFWDVVEFKRGLLPSNNEEEGFYIEANKKKERFEEVKLPIRCDFSDVETQQLVIHHNAGAKDLTFSIVKTLKRGTRVVDSYTGVGFNDLNVTNPYEEKFTSIHWMGVIIKRPQIVDNATRAVNWKNMTKSRGDLIDAMKKTWRMLAPEGTIIIDPAARLELIMEIDKTFDQTTQGFYKVITVEEIKQMTDIIGKLRYKTEETEETIGSNGKKKTKSLMEKRIEDVIEKTTMSKQKIIDLWKDMLKFRKLFSCPESLIAMQQELNNKKQNNLNDFLNQYTDYNALKHVDNMMHSLNIWKEIHADFGPLPGADVRECFYIIATKDATQKPGGSGKKVSSKK